MSTEAKREPSEESCALEYCRYCERWLAIPDRICVGCGNRLQRLARPLHARRAANRHRPDRQRRSAPRARYQRPWELVPIEGRAALEARHQRPWELVPIETVISDRAGTGEERGNDRRTA
jgi:hypothetical protein